MNQNKKVSWTRVPWRLMGFDAATILLVNVVVYIVRASRGGTSNLLVTFAVTLVGIMLARFGTGSYRRIWRYGGITSYLQLLAADVIAFVLEAVFCRIVTIRNLTGIVLIFITETNFCLSIALRMMYRYLFQNGYPNFKYQKQIARIINAITGKQFAESKMKAESSSYKIRAAIVGAGRMGATLAKELIDNAASEYCPVCFFEVDESKIDRQVYGMNVYSEKKVTKNTLEMLNIRHVIVAIAKLSPDDRKALYDKYKAMDMKVLVYDYPVKNVSNGGKLELRQFEIEDLLFRKPLTILKNDILNFYKDRTVLITGGGGSIGSELCRQVAGMKPARLVIVDVYENNAYDIQQELRNTYGDELKLNVEIATICDIRELETIFALYRPDIVLHAAAHKHVPLMEHNCCEAVRNNVFGTYNVVRTAEKFHVKKFIMVSTDKAVNPTNVMGATKRMCEMIVLSRNGHSDTVFACTRFGNVLGSNGSVIPLFKRQIEKGGPVTITDKRIIRYFMTIPEASQLVLTSGAMSKVGELFVLDMGKPVHILELAENMIRLSGYKPYEDIQIIETGLRPGEKLYEELLIQSETLSKTGNNMIFVEKDIPHTPEQIQEKLEILNQALDTDDDNAVRDALRQVVPTFRKPEEVNKNAAQTNEMKQSI